jgi:acetyl esterase/lipase
MSSPESYIGGYIQRDVSPGENGVCKPMRRLAKLLAFLSLSLNSLSYYKLKSSSLDPSILVYGLKLLAGAFAPVLALVGLVGAALGLLSRAPLALISGGLGAILSAGYVRRVTAPHAGFERAFGPGWRDRIPAERAARMLQRRWTWRVPAPPKPRFEQDIPFWTIVPSAARGAGPSAARGAGPSAARGAGPSAARGAGGTGRLLLCDIWRPASSVKPSGLALVYLHAGGWQQFDKDTYTRPFFSYLAAQGHVIMDVSYRLCHEADLFGIVGDVKRAIAWIKANAKRYGVDPKRVVAAGGSAGGHLALLAAYTSNHPQLDPEDVRGADTSVRAVISYYGLPDVRWLGTQPGKPSSRAFIEFGKKVGYVTASEYLEWPDIMRKLLGGLPPEVPDVAALMSPITHVGPHCPPTLLFHGSHDRVVPVQDARNLYRALSEAGVVVVYVELPQVVHAFDLAAPRMSPPAQAALYDVERFLALMATKDP